MVQSLNRVVFFNILLPTSLRYIKNLSFFINCYQRFSINIPTLAGNVKWGFPMRKRWQKTFDFSNNLERQKRNDAGSECLKWSTGSTNCKMCELSWVLAPAKLQCPHLYTGCSKTWLTQLGGEDDSSPGKLRTSEEMLAVTLLMMSIHLPP